MEEKNPLEIHTAVLSKRTQINKRGRPTLGKVINFTSQPKSIISQILNKAALANHSSSREKNRFSETNISSDRNDTKEINLEPEIQKQLIDTFYEDIHGSFTLQVVESEDTHDDITQVYDLNESFSLLDSRNDQGNLINDDKTGSPLAEITCYVCSHRSSSHRAHRKHMSIHRNQPYKCNFPDCSYESKQSSNLIKHKRIHTSEKPYLCDQCTFRTNFGNSLKVHKRTHTSERPYGCLYCSYRCNSSSNLKKHCLHRHPKPPDQ